MLRILALVVPVLLHGFYDYILSVELEGSTVIFFAYVILLDAAALLLLKKLSKKDRPL